MGPLKICDFMVICDTMAICFYSTNKEVESILKSHQVEVGRFVNNIT